MTKLKNLSRRSVKPELMLKMITFRTASLSELKNLLEVIHE